MKTVGIRLEIRELNIPFKQSFKHNSAERSKTQSVIVLASEGEFKGYGESCPREYVTNESVQSVFQFFTEVKDDLLSHVDSLESLQQYHNKHKSIIDKSPSAWCAIELALLDLFAKKEHCSIEKLLGIPELGDSFFYSAVIGDGSFETFEKVALQYLQMGFKDFKIKISGVPELDFPKFELLKKLGGDDCKIRLDANNLWTDAAEVVSYLKKIPAQLSGLEEPLSGKDLSQLKSLANQINVPLILDESFSLIEQIPDLISHHQSFIINLRISKMGGLINSIAIAKQANKEEIGLIIGAQVGETSILTRAALSIASLTNGRYRAMEGAFGTFLLEHDIVENPLMLGKGGELKPRKLLSGGAGFQLDVREYLMH